MTGFLRAIAAAPKPLIAAVRGNAVGVGTTMLLHCDLVVAAPSARFQVPFVNLGLVPEAASSLLLPRLIGHQRASAMVLLGEALDADTALAAGIVNRVVPDADLEVTARAMAATLAAKAADGGPARESAAQGRRQRGSGANGCGRRPLRRPAEVG